MHEMDLNGRIEVMKKAIFIITICSLIVIGGILTTYMYLNYADYITYQNGIFVSKEGVSLYETANCLYKSI
ncbi:MAG: hypothetical protein K0S71_623 [Clostridia bacterium]|jgi:hypothetical protein|nr:hypothetical protein [Clostridia bacterium]